MKGLEFAGFQRRRIACENVRVGYVVGGMIVGMLSTIRRSVQLRCMPSGYMSRYMKVSKLNIPIWRARERHSLTHIPTGN